MGERMMTHSAGCWRWHIDCAVARVERLEADNERLTMQLEHCKLGRLVALLKKLNNDHLIDDVYVEMVLTECGLTWDDAIGGDE